MINYLKLICLFFWHSSINSTNNNDRNPASKPPYSYVALIAMAIQVSSITPFRINKSKTRLYTIRRVCDKETRTSLRQTQNKHIKPCNATASTKLRPLAQKQLTKTHIRSARQLNPCTAHIPRATLFPT